MVRVCVKCVWLECELWESVQREKERKRERMCDMGLCDMGVYVCVCDMGVYVICACVCVCVRVCMRADRPGSS